MGGGGGGSVLVDLTPWVSYVCHGHLSIVLGWGAIQSIHFHKM